MSTLQIVTSLTSALACPLIVGGVLLAFRRELRRWLGERPVTIKMGAFAVEWEKNATQVTAGLTELAGPLIAERQPEGHANVRLKDTSDPQAAETVRATLSTLADKLRTALIEANVKEAEEATLQRLVTLGIASDVIHPAIGDSMMGLVVMGNLALANPENIGERELTEFQAIAAGSFFSLELQLRPGGNLGPRPQAGPSGNLGPRPSIDPLHEIALARK